MRMFINRCLIFIFLFSASVNSQSVDYKDAIANWSPDCNIGGTRQNSQIDTYVNHYIGTGTYEGAISWFKKCPGTGSNQRGINPTTGKPYGSSSTHFIISREGEITQMTPLNRIAYHAGANGYNNNTRSIGVEHEVTIDNPEWWNETEMLRSSANLACHLTNQIGITQKRLIPGISGHNDMPGTNTLCPGNLPWDNWFNLLEQATVNGCSINNNTPDNDNCSDAINLNSNTSCSKTYGSVAGATGSYGANSCKGCGSCEKSEDDKDVYYKFIAVKESHTVTASDYASNFDAVIELRKACASGTSNYISCYDPSGAPSAVTYTWDNLNIGQEYYIRVYEYNYSKTPPSSDRFSICVTHEGGGDGNSDEDIYLSDIKVSSTRVKAGDEISVSAKQHYQGSRKESELPAFDLDYYLSKDCQLSSNDIRIGSDSSGLGSDDPVNQESESVAIPSNTATGNYYILFSADNDQELDEQNEDNNIACVQIEIYEDKAKLPDLEISSLTATPNKDLSYAEEIEVKMAIANRGESSSEQFKVLVFIDLDGDSEYDENEKLGIIPFESLDGSRGKIKYINFTLPSVFPNNGNYNLFAIADFDNDVNESNEQNNITHVEIQVTEAINYADLHFEIETTNLTCRESKGGILRVKALNTNYKYSFEVRLAGNKISDGALESSNNWEETRTQLTADEYSIHITIDGISTSEFEKVYRIGITEPAPLFVSSGEITSSSSKRYFDVENGTAPFKVFKNGAFVKESYDSHIVIETAHLDVIEVHTAKSCEGIYTEQIFDEVFVLYPNPILNEVNIKMPKGVSNVSPVLFDINGRLIYTLNGNQEKQLLHIPLPSLAKGIYYLKLEPIGKTFKIMKE